MDHRAPFLVRTPKCFFTYGETFGSKGDERFGAHDWVPKTDRVHRHLRVLKMPRGVPTISRRVIRKGEVTCPLVTSMPFWKLGVEHTDDFQVLPILFK